MKRIKRRIRQVSFLTLLVFSFHLFHPFFSAYIHAQTLGTITGKVTDAETGESLGDILVMAVLKEGSEATLETARTYIKDGTYTITDLPEGAYQVFIELLGCNASAKLVLEDRYPRACAGHLKRSSCA